MEFVSEEFLPLDVSSQEQMIPETYHRASRKGTPYGNGNGNGKGNGKKGVAQYEVMEAENKEANACNAALRRKKWINHEITRMANTGNINELLKTIKSFLPEMNGVNLATALHRVSKLVAHQGQASIWHVTEHKVFKDLHAKVLEHVLSCVCPSSSGNKPKGWEKREGHMKMYGLSVSSWAFAVLRKPDPVLFDAIEKAALPNLLEFKPFELANLVWGFTKLGHGSEHFFNSIAEHVCQRQMGTFGLQDICMVAWSFASSRRLNNTTNQLFFSIATEVSANADIATPQEIAMTFWSFAKIGYKDTALFMRLASIVMQRQLLGKFNPQEISNTAWAFATASIKHEALFFEVAKFSVFKQGQMVPQNVANILWSFAKLQVHGPATKQLFKALLPRTQHSMDQYKQCELTATFWAATKIEQRTMEYYPFFVMVAEYFVKKKSEITPRAMVSLLVSSCAEPNLGFFFDLLAVETVKHMTRFDPTTLCCLLRGNALAYQKAREHKTLMSPLRRDGLQRVMAHIEMRIGEMNRHHLVHIVTSLQQLNGEKCDDLCDAIQRAALTQWQQFSLTNFRHLILGLSKTRCKIRLDFQHQCLQSGCLTRAFGANIVNRIFDFPESVERQHNTSCEDIGVSLEDMQSPQYAVDEVADFVEKPLDAREPARIPLGHTVNPSSVDRVMLGPPPRLEGYVGCPALPTTELCQVPSADVLPVQLPKDNVISFPPSELSSPEGPLEFKFDDDGGIVWNYARDRNAEDSGDEERSNPSCGSGGSDSLFLSGLFFASDPWSPWSEQSSGKGQRAKGRAPVRVPEPKYMGHSFEPFQAEQVFQPLSPPTPKRVPVPVAPPSWEPAKISSISLEPAPFGGKHAAPAFTAAADFNKMWVDSWW
jgi:hypothetical protein